MTCMVSSRAKKGTGPFIKLFGCSNDLIPQKVYFPRLTRVYVGLIMLVARTRFPFFLMISRVWDISSDIGTCFPLAGGLCKFYSNAGGKQPMQRQYRQQANPLLSIRNYTLLLISRNDKNEQLTIIKPT
jgi:hypothetical protein